jgi:hypothetical protein
MANNFKLKTFDGSSTPATNNMDVYTGQSGTETTIIGMSIANIASSQILVSVKIISDTVDVETNTDAFLVKDAPIPVGGSLVVVGGDQKLVIQDTDVVRVTSDTANSADTVMSVLEIA